MDVLICKPDKPDTWQEALFSCADTLKKQDYVKENFYEEVVKRELRFPTGLQLNICGVAIPHTDPEFVKKPGLCFMKLPRPVVFRNMEDDEQEVSVQLIFMLAVSAKGDHMSFLTSVIHAIQDERFLQDCLALKDDELTALVKTRFSA